MDMTDKERAEKIRETLGDVCGVVELQRVSEEDAMRWVVREAKARGVAFSEDAARELVDALGSAGGAEMMLVASEVEKLLLYVGGVGKATVEVGDVETMVSAAKQRSLYELTDAISMKDAPQGAGAAGGVAECVGGWGRCGDRARVFAGEDVSADAGAERETGEGSEGDVVGVVAGISGGAVCGGCADCAGAAVSGPRRVDAWTAVDCEGGFGVAVGAGG